MRLYLLQCGSCELGLDVLIPHTGRTGHVLAPIPALVVQTEQATYVIDTGMPDEWIERDESLDGEDIFPRMSREDTVVARLATLGLAPRDVTHVINTHLHFDHAGGNTYRDAGGAIRASMPNARYVVQRGEHHFATHLNERTAASYFAHNFEPIREAGRLDLVEGEREIVPGITVLPTPGHVPFHQSVLLRSRGETALYLGDLVPTTTHLPLPWIMGYDVDPLVTLETKRRILLRMEAEGWLALFEHDAFHAWGHVVHDGKAYGLGSASH